MDFKEWNKRRMKPILCTSDLRNIHVCFATESSTKCFEHLRSPLKKTRAWLRCKKIENCKVKLEYWNLHPTELLKVEWLLAKMLAIKNARDQKCSRSFREQNSSRSRSRCEQNASRSLIAIAICSRNARDQCTYDSEPHCMSMEF